MNKKVVILIVFVECVLAIFLVGIWGMAIDGRFSKIGCTDIWFEDANGVRYDEGATIEIELSLNEEGEAYYQLYHGIAPDDITNPSVRYNTNKPDKVVVAKDGKVTFYAIIPVTITIMADDGTAKQATIRIVPKENKDVIIDPGFFD